jgi:ribosomal protein S18 acetylase RimI-like enzyme
MKSGHYLEEVSTRPASDADSACAYEVKKQALGTYITRVWGWDEEVQEDFHSREFDSARLEIVTLAGRDIGTIEVVSKIAHILINKLYLLPAFQNQGIGSRLVRDVLDRAKRMKLPVCLSVLKINPAWRLYERLGFRKVEETETHWRMEWSS